MQFKHPELLWALFLLLIPIIIHLFQLRRFKKTPFTNVKFLKKVVSESRRSQLLKKWLMLLTRLTLLAALVFAFAQPFFASRAALLEKETVIYLDDSFSMQAKSNATTLLEDALQSIIKSVPKNQKFTLFTNEKVFRQVSLPEVQNDLLAIAPSTKQLKLNEIFLKGNTFFTGDDETIKHLVVISDFQNRMVSAEMDTTSSIKKHLVKLSPDATENISVDSLYVDSQNSDNIELTAIISRTGSIANTPVSLFNGEQLIAKTSAVFDEDDTSDLQFTLPKNERINGKLEVSDSGLTYDNQLYFNIDANKKIKVLAIGETDADYLRRIYTDDAFEFKATKLNKLNFADLETQNLIVLNELPTISTAMANSLKSFSDNGGSLAIIPSVKIDFESYNILTNNYLSTSFIQELDVKRTITDISFAHPLFRNVFEKNVTNFQFPEVSRYYKIKTNAPTALAFQDKAPFLIGDTNVYLFTASLSPENSNFKNSPLIVPTFYQMGNNSLKLPPPYSVLGTFVSVDIPVKLRDDTILKVAKNDYEFIPQQQAYPNKVTLSFDENITEDGMYTVSQDDKQLSRISFNYDRQESDLNYADINVLNGAEETSSIEALFDTLETDSRITELWIWFVILALTMVLLEALLQKFMT
ncbi:MAG: BatA domain-containing protein [Pricia sp.]